MSPKPKLEEIAQQRGKSVLAVLAEEYAKHGSQKKVAESLGLSPSTVRYALLCLGVREKTVLVLDNTGYQLSPEGRQMIRGAK